MKPRKLMQGKSGRSRGPSRCFTIISKPSRRSASFGGFGLRLVRCSSRLYD